MPVDERRTVDLGGPRRSRDLSGDPRPKVSDWAAWRSNPKETMEDMSEIEAFTLDLKVEGQTLLFLLLSADGAVNRFGSGTLTDSDSALYIAQTDGSMFREVVPCIDETWLDRPGEYVARHREGKECSLTIAFHLKAPGEEEGSIELKLRYLYADQSEGPPEAIREFVLAAIGATLPWYEEQQRIAGHRD